MSRACRIGDAWVRCIVSKHPHADALFVYTFEGGRQVVSCLPVEETTRADTPYHVVLPGQRPEDEDEVEVVMLRGVWSHGMFSDKPLAPVKQHSGPVFVKWPSITHLNNVSAWAKKTMPYDVTAEYRAKIKLHGSNAAVQVLSDNRGVAAQSRTRLITPDQDNYGFATWVEARKAQWLACQPGVYFGEWCGQGVNSGDAICQVPEKQFCIFAVVLPDGEDRVLYDPNDIAQHGVPDGVHILPWFGAGVTLHLKSEEEEEDERAINGLVAQVGERDPWVEATFGVQGSGEGLVLYPTRVNGKPVTHLHELRQYMFKAKVENHAAKIQTHPAQKKTEVPASIQAFVQAAVTPARCEQGFGETGVDGSNDKQFGVFLKWLKDDVAKEMQDELAAGGLALKEVTGELAKAARAWWTAR